jgi:UDP-N-acetylmuramate dehydrogenase
LLPIEQNRSLKPLTTFKIGGPARYFIEITDPAQLSEAFEFAESRNLPVLILGGGSNMLVSDRGFDGLVIHIANRGIVTQTSVCDLEPESQTEEASPTMCTTLRVASGEVWDDVVKFAVEHNLWGIENLSRIPGRTGAVAVQNVGAYGQEIKDVLLNVEVFDRTTKTFQTLSNEACKFSYRKSIFNTTEKNRYIILYTTLVLGTTPKRNLSYPDVKKWFEENPEPSLREIREAIKTIRDRKFPFPAESVEGNAGSFFKNSLLTEDQYVNLERKFEENLPEHLAPLRTIRVRSEGQEIKIPSAFILESCGLKGFQRGNVQLNPTQPVVVLNVTREATADEVLSVVKEVREIVEEKTGLHLYTEPELIGFSAEELRGYGFNEEEIKRYIDLK